MERIPLFLTVVFIISVLLLSIISYFLIVWFLSACSVEAKSEDSNEIWDKSEATVAMKNTS